MVFNSITPTPVRVEIFMSYPSSYVDEKVGERYCGKPPENLQVLRLNISTRQTRDDWEEGTLIRSGGLRITRTLAIELAPGRKESTPWRPPLWTTTVEICHNRYIDGQCLSGSSMLSSES